MAVVLPAKDPESVVCLRKHYMASLDSALLSLSIDFSSLFLRLTLLQGQSSPL